MNDTKKKIITKAPTQSELKDLETVQKIKPKLRKFLIDSQRKRAQEVAEATQKENKELLASDEIIKRASQLASQALLEKTIWQRIRPYLPMNWTTMGSNTPELAREMHSDIAGFATYLVRENNNYMKLRTTGKGYPNPMQESNIEFFWSKFNADLKLLIEAETRRVKAGNASVILGKKNAEGNIEPIKKRFIN
jgi:hypothetical protein